MLSGGGTRGCGGFAARGEKGAMVEAAMVEAAMVEAAMVEAAT